MRTILLCHNVLLFLLLSLLSPQNPSTTAADLPTTLYGVEIGKTTTEQATKILNLQDRPVKEKPAKRIPGCKYLFIYSSDKPIELWGQSWVSVMYVASKVSTKPVNEAFVSTGFMPADKADDVFNEIAATLNASFSKYLTENTSTCKVYRHGHRYLRLAERKAKKGGNRYVYVQVGIDD